MLHMKHRHVLVEDDFKPLRRSDLQKVERLLGSEIAGNGQPFQSLIDQEMGGKGVGNIQGEIPMESEAGTLEIGHAAKVA